MSGGDSSILQIQKLERQCVFKASELGDSGCQHMTCTYEGWEGELYRCHNCGLSYFLSYEDMK